MNTGTEYARAKINLLSWRILTAKSSAEWEEMKRQDKWLKKVLKDGEAKERSGK